MRASARPQVVEVVERQDVLEPRVARAVVLDLRELFRVLDEHAHRLGVVEDVLAVLGGAVRVDRGADGADVGEREVELRPLEARLPEDPEGVALLDAERQEPVGELLDGGRGLAPGDRLPCLAALDEVRRAAPPLRDRVRQSRGIVLGWAPCASGRVSGATWVAIRANCRWRKPLRRAEFRPVRD